jgi:hypothetical protein
VQVEPMKPVLTAPGIKRLKFKYDWPLSIFAFNFNMRCYIEHFSDETAAHVSMDVGLGVGSYIDRYFQPKLNDLSYYVS